MDSLKIELPDGSFALVDDDDAVVFIFSASPARLLLLKLTMLILGLQNEDIDGLLAETLSELIDAALVRLLAA